YFRRRVDEAFVKIGTDFFDGGSQALWDRFQKSDDRFFLAIFKHGQYDRFSSIVAGTDNGDKIAMPFEQRDFVQSDLAQLFELIPGDFASDLSVEHAARAIVRNTIFDRDVADCAVNKRAQKKIGEGFGAILHQHRTTRSARSSSDGLHNPGSD